MNNNKKYDLIVFGATGFIGTRFYNLFPEQTIPIARESREPQSKNVLYMISTVDNYNVYSDPQLYVNTNLTVVIETLEKCKGNSDIVL